MSGSKYKNLLKLKENGFNVADFVTIKYEDVINDPNKIYQVIGNIKDKSNKEKSILLKKCIEHNFKLDTKIKLKCDKYAVRSSSNIEDGNDNSFAGQFDTYLNVEKEDLTEKIKECFKSLYNENVLDYLTEKKIDITDLKMNVIVQQMVQSEYSGVIFTSNPQGILNESVIVVGKGLGERVVSDRTNTTSYYYNINDKLYYFEGTDDFLSRKQVEELIELSQNITNMFGNYLDIEFGIFNNQIYILQVRPITTIDDSNPLVFDNSNIVESYPGVSLPLTITFVESVYSGVFKGLCKRILKNEKKINEIKDIFNNMVGSTNGRMYYKISNWYTLIKLLPFSKKIIPIWQEMLGVKNKTIDKDKDKVKTLLGFRLRVYINSFYEIIKVQKNMKKLNKKFIKIKDEFNKEFTESLSEQKIINLYNKIEEKILSCWDVTLLNDLYTFIFTGLLKKHLKKNFTRYEEISNKCISGITNIESMKPIRELISIAYKKDDYSKEEYNKVIDEYIEEFGDRNIEELKLESKTFRTNPELLDDKIEEYRQDMDRLAELYKNIYLKENDNNLKLDSISNLLIKKCTQGIKNREISRLNRSRIYGMVRTMFLRLGEIYQSQELIKTKEDIFYLKLEEIRDMISNKEPKFNVIQQRKIDYKLYKCLPAYSRIVFMKNEFNKSHTNINMKNFYTNHNQLIGTPCSNGIVRAEALVITNVSDARNVKDKILITKMTDPGWVFLLASAKGIISEKGSLLSHTAIISRELKIPSIVGVNNLLNTIRSGDIIEMDGTTGIVKIINIKKEKD